MNQGYSVSQVNQYIKNMFVKDYALNNIYIKGEVSNCKYHSSGHIYFTLKDPYSQIACVMFAGQRSGLGFQMKEGHSVIALGSVSIYERDGKYQLYAREIFKDGAGLLYQKFEELKEKLEKEGLFQAEKKKPIPYVSKKIGIVTASTGAAIQDMINVSSRRNPYAQLMLYPSKVQGEGAAESIVAGIQYLDKLGVDVIIIGRGGGSIEDLWAFNEETVARAVYDCNTPIISAVGHETDTTIADYVADLRAPTPSAAAELAVCNIQELFQNLQEMENRIYQLLIRKIQGYRNQIDKCKMQLEYASPLYQIRQKRQYLVDAQDKLEQLMWNQIREKRHRLEIAIEKMKVLSPLHKLNGGYAFLTDQKGQMVKSIGGISTGDVVRISVTDGEIFARVEELVERSGLYGKGDK